MTQEFRMHCGLADGYAGILRVMSTAQQPNLERMNKHMRDLENSVSRMRVLLDEATDNYIESMKR
mgnify:CR=1 FL=1